MGYSNEYASLNQSGLMKKYCDKKLKEKLKNIHKQRRLIESENFTVEDNLIYDPKKKEVPAVSVDGGIATLFPGHVEEIKIIKVAYGFSEEDSEFFKKYIHEPVVFHIFSGVLKWNAGAGINPKTNQIFTKEELLEELLEEFLSLDILIEMIKNFNLDKVSLHKELHSFLKVRVKKRGDIDDVIREIMEWALIVNFWYRVPKNEKLPCLMIKDGSLFPGKQTMSIDLSQSIENFLLDKTNIIVGVIKSSRFVDSENSWSRIIKKYAHELTGIKFFKLNEKLERQIDDKEINYQRYFLSLYDAERLYEIQLPNSFKKETKLTKEILNGLSNLVTLSHGGSIITNSYAHENASLSQFDAKLVTEDLSNELDEFYRGLK